MTDKELRLSSHQILLLGFGALLLAAYLVTGVMVVLVLGVAALVLLAMRVSGNTLDMPWQGHGIPAPCWYLAATLGGALLLVGLATPNFSGAAFWDPNGAFASPALLDVLWLLMTVGMAAAPLVAVRRFWLGVVLALVPPAGFTAISVTHDFPVLGAISLLACGLTGAWTKPAAPWFAGVIALAPVLAAVWSGGALVGPGMVQNEFTHHTDLPYLLFTSALFAIAFLLVCLFGLVWRRFVVRSEEARQALARAGQVEEQSAVVEERARLARDLHDVVAHHVSLIAVRAETAPYTHTDLGPSAKTVLSDIAADARLALDELRGVLGILGRAGEGAERTPQPTWDDIAALVERTKAAGLDVTLEGETVVNVPATVGYAAYRVVQEGLTNARKHAPGAPARVVLSATDRLVHVSVRNPAATPAASIGGRGLVGMQERVSALGGRMTAGAVAGEYVVEVTLPVVPS